MWYLSLVVGLGAIIIFIKRYDGSRRDSGFDFDWIGDLTSDSDSDGGGDSGGGEVSTTV
jgi:hypothetical protein